MKFKTNKQNNILKIEAEYIDYRDILRVNIKIFSLISLAFILKNSDDIKSYESSFSFGIKYLFFISSKYNIELEKLYIKFNLLFFINITYDLLKKEEDNKNFNEVFLDEIFKLNYIQNYTNNGEFNLKLDKPIDIIIPVYNGFQYLGNLFNSIFLSTHIDYRLIIIEDKSSDDKVLPYLKQLNKDNYPNCKDIILLQNEENLGFVKSVNKGANLANNHFVLLNTDVVVPNGWLERLIYPLYHSDIKIASITPFTNAGVYFSFPKVKEKNELIGNYRLEEIDNAFRYTNPIITKNVFIHSGTGFCMAINYDCWKKIGNFDEEAFGKGYCEEDDWCFRAVEKNYNNILCPNLFVYHKHSGSFGESRELLVKEHMKILQERYPNQMFMVKKHDIENPFKLYRFYAVINLIKNSEKNLLFIDYDVKSGEDYNYSENKINSFISENYNIVIFKHDNIDNNYSITIKNKYLNDFEYIYCKSFSDIEYIFNMINISYVFINNTFYMTESDLLKTMYIIKNYKNKYNFILEYVFHDFYSLCPSCFLLDKNTKYCYIPCEAYCFKCINNKNFLVNISSINIWRDLWRAFFGICDSLVCFSESSYKIITKVYKKYSNKLKVIPHENLVIYNTEYNPNLWNNNNEIINIGFFGDFHEVKGAKIVLELSNILKNKNITYNIYLFGKFSYSYNKKHFDNIKYIGKYNKNLIPDTLNKYNIDIVIFPAIWPETFSYIVSELMEANVPIVCFNLGAQAERVSKYDKGYIAKDISAEAMFDCIMEFYNKKFIY